MSGLDEKLISSARAEGGEKELKKWKVNPVCSGRKKRGIAERKGAKAEKFGRNGRKSDTRKSGKKIDRQTDRKKERR